MSISTNCPACMAKFKLADEMAGKRVKCQKCQTVFAVPKADAVAATSDELPVPSASETDIAPSPAAKPRPTPEKPRWDDEDRDEDAPRRRPRRDSIRKRPAESGSSMATILMLVLGGGGVLSCLACGSVVAFVLYADQGAVQQKQVAVAVRAVPPQPMPPQAIPPPPVAIQPPDAMKGVKDFNPNFEPAKDKKRIASPAPPGGTNVVFGPDGMYRSDGILNPNDPSLTFTNDFFKVTKRCKTYLVPCEVGKTYTIDLMTQAFDAYLYLVDDANNLLAEDDDSGGNLNSRIIFRPTRTAMYRIHATALDPRFGNFTLTIRKQ